MRIENIKRETEQELKFAVCEKEFEYLQEVFAAKSGKTQRNYYFDTRNMDFYQRKIVVRIREIEGMYVLTAKVGKKADWADYCNQEFNCMIPAEKADEFLREGMSIGIVYELLGEECTENSQADKLFCIGKMTTLRYETDFCGGFVCLDHNSYMDKTDYELEFEYKTVEQKEKLIVFLREKNVEMRASSSKFIRLLGVI
jgi:uncharacterized protein YjbK